MNVASGSRTWDGLIRACGWLAVVLGGAALLGWVAHFTVLLQLSPGWPPIKANSALCLIVAGTAVALLPGGHTRPATWGGGAVVLVGLLTLLEYVAGGGGWIDEFFVADYITAADAFPGRMSALSATCFLSLGGGLLCAGLTRLPRWRLAVSGLIGCGLAVVAVLAQLGYVAGMRAAYSLGTYTHMALQTTIALLVLGVALLVWAAQVARREQFNLARYLPVTGSVTLMVMVACVAANARTEQDFRDTTHLLVVESVLAAGLLLLAHLMASREVERRRVSEQRFRGAFDDAPIGMCLVSTEGRLLKVNRALVTLLGYSEEELLRTDFQTLTHPEDLESDLTLVDLVLSGELSSYQMEKRYLRRDGGIAYTSLSVSLVRDSGNNPLYFVSQIENIAHRREMDRLKREFISTVSHELRTPLTSIRGSLGLVEGGVMGELPEKARAMVKIAHQNSERLVRIINDILDVEKIESGRLELQIANVPVALLLRDALEYNAPYGEKYKVRFVLESAPPEAQVRADPDRLLQVLANLLSNAAKFSPPGAEVCVRAEQRGDRIQVAVRDRGTGIPDEFRARIFEKFAQADGSSARRFEGTGLGLNITRRLVEAMQGTIGFTTAVGEGTTFYFELPAAAPSDGLAVVDQRAQTARHRVLSPVRERVPRILHVEDDCDLSKVIEAALAGRAQLVTATTLKGAEDLLRGGGFAVLVLDLGLPDGNGLALLDRLEELVPEPIPVVILSVSEVPQAVQQRVAASLVKSCLSEAEVVETILTLVPQEA